MEMKLKLRDWIDINQVLRAMIDREEIPVSTVTKFHILGILKAIEGHMANFEAVRNEKIKEYGEADQDGNYSISLGNPSAIDAFSRDMKKLLEEPVSATIDKIAAKAIMVKGVKSGDLLCLYPILEENKELPDSK